MWNFNIHNLIQDRKEQEEEEEQQQQIQWSNAKMSPPSLLFIYLPIYFYLFIF